MTMVAASSARRPLPCVVSSHANNTHTSTLPVANQNNIEPDANSGETKLVLASHLNLVCSPVFCRWLYL